MALWALDRSFSRSNWSWLLPSPMRRATIRRSRTMFSFQTEQKPEQKPFHAAVGTSPSSSGKL